MSILTIRFEQPNPLLRLEGISEEFPDMVPMDISEDPVQEYAFQYCGQSAPVTLYNALRILGSLAERNMALEAKAQEDQNAIAGLQSEVRANKQLLETWLRLIYRVFRLAYWMQAKSVDNEWWGFLVLSHLFASLTGIFVDYSKIQQLEDEKRRLAEERDQSKEQGRVVVHQRDEAVKLMEEAQFLINGFLMGILLARLQHQLERLTDELSEVTSSRSKMQELLGNATQWVVYFARECRRARNANVLHAVPLVLAFTMQLEWDVSLLVGRLGGDTEQFSQYGLGPTPDAAAAVELGSALIQLRRDIRDFLLFISRIQTLASAMAGDLESDSMVSNHIESFCPMVDERSLMPELGAHGVIPYQLREAHPSRDPVLSTASLFSRNPSVPSSSSIVSLLAEITSGIPPAILDEATSVVTEGSSPFSWEDTPFPRSVVASTRESSIFGDGTNFELGDLDALYDPALYLGETFSPPGLSSSLLFTV
ncbi:hypothetical protein V5O48_017001 [Marasmius crinis-equi]|uniref:Uncharacterized protein n=1 Tax=Marasmius crinis-equi TaxID=585013 RepID=A0ABR3EQE9_9AGAR